MVGATTQTDVYLVYYSAEKLIQLTSLTSAQLATLKKKKRIRSGIHVKATQVEIWIFPSKHVYISGSHITLYEAKQKSIWAGLVTVWMGRKCIFMFK